jgi:hypothetical protein
VFCLPTESIDLPQKVMTVKGVTIKGTKGRKKGTKGEKVVE